MSEIRTQKCDGEGCKKLRVDDTNNWLVAWLKNGILHLSLMGNKHCPPFGDEKHFCGEQCATRWFLIEMGKLRGHNTVHDLDSSI